jgi:hypothetical protein
MDTTAEGTEEQCNYLSYLLRLWRVSNEQEPVWRASLKSSRSGESVSFASLEELFDFLQRQTGLALEADGK